MTRAALLQLSRVALIDSQTNSGSEFSADLLEAKQTRRRPDKIVKCGTRIIRLRDLECCSDLKKRNQRCLEGRPGFF